jgi:hypothetical protein
VSRKVVLTACLVLLTGCDGPGMSADCRAVLATPAPSLMQLENRSTHAEDGSVRWSIYANNPGLLPLVLDLSRDRDGSAVAPRVTIPPGHSAEIFSVHARPNSGAHAFIRPRFVFSRRPDAQRDPREPIVMAFPIEPKLVRFSQTPIDGAGFLRRPSHTAEIGNLEALDLDAPFGTIVTAPVDGLVVYTHRASPDVQCNHATHSAYANLVVIVTEDDVMVTLGHLALDSALVEQGDRVKAGDPVARVGRSGSGDRPHLHLVAQAIGATEIESIPIRFAGCSGNDETWTPRNGPACR